MNLNKYVPSKGIREYYDKIGYELSVEQAAYAIYSNRYADDSEQCRDLRELIDNTDDVALKKPINGAKTLHALLYNYASYKENMISEYRTSGADSVYVMSVIKNYNTISLEVYDSLSRCEDAIKRYDQGCCISDDEVTEQLKEYVSVTSNWDTDYDDIIIKKQWLDDPDHYTTGYLMNGVEAINLWSHLVSPLKESEKYLKSLYKGIPFPFTTGDILEEWDGIKWWGNFVFVKNTEYESGLMMNIEGYWVKKDGRIKKIKLLNPFCMDYCTCMDKVRPLTISLSDCINGNMDIGDFLNVYDEARGI